MALRKSGLRDSAVSPRGGWRCPFVTLSIHTECPVVHRQNPGFPQESARLSPNRRARQSTGGPVTRKQNPGASASARACPGPGYRARRGLPFGGCGCEGVCVRIPARGTVAAVRCTAVQTRESRILQRAAATLRNSPPCRPVNRASCSGLLATLSDSPQCRPVNRASCSGLLATLSDSPQCRPVNRASCRPAPTALRTPPPPIPDKYVYPDIPRGTGRSTAPQWQKQEGARTFAVRRDGC
jgi:hypothetical protein